MGGFPRGGGGLYTNVKGVGAWKNGLNEEWSRETEGDHCIKKNSVLKMNIYMYGNSMWTLDTIMIMTLALVKAVSLIM